MKNQTVNESITVSFSADDLAFLSNAIGETWEALGGDDEAFKQRTGRTPDDADKIRAGLKAGLRGVATADGAETVTISILPQDLRFLCNACDVTLKAVEEWEFQTRTGSTVEEASNVLARIRKLLDAMNRRQVA
jgi:hypothetical protein